MKIVAIILAFVFCHRVWSVSPNCYRPKNASKRIIYLHGMDIPTLNKQELTIRAFLNEISKKHNVEIFLPRATQKCPNHDNQICWMWNPEKIEVLKLQKQSLLKQSKKCFKSAGPVIWLGFSNGGNRLNQFFQACEDGTYITFGASGGSLSKPIKDLSSCGNLYSFIGKSDKWNYQRGVELYKKFKDSGAKIIIKEFDGGHELKKDLLSKLISEL